MDPPPKNGTSFILIPWTQLGALFLTPRCPLKYILTMLNGWLPEAAVEWLKGWRQMFVAPSTLPFWLAGPFTASRDECGSSRAVMSSALSRCPESPESPEKRRKRRPGLEKCWETPWTFDISTHFGWEWPEWQLGRMLSSPHGSGGSRWAEILGDWRPLRCSYEVKKVKQVPTGRGLMAQLLVTSWFDPPRTLRLVKQLRGGITMRSWNQQLRCRILLHCPNTGCETFYDEQRLHLGAEISALDFFPTCCKLLREQYQPVSLLFFRV